MIHKQCRVERGKEALKPIVSSKCTDMGPHYYTAVQCSQVSFNKFAYKGAKGHLSQVINGPLEFNNN